MLQVQLPPFLFAFPCFLLRLQCSDRRKRCFADLSNFSIAIPKSRKHLHLVFKSLKFLDCQVSHNQ